MRFIVMIVLCLCCAYANGSDIRKDIDSEMEFMFEGNWYTESELTRMWEQQNLETQKIGDTTEKHDDNESEENTSDINELEVDIEENASDETFMNYIDEKLSKLSHLFMSDEYLKEHKHDDETHLEFILNNITNYMTFDKLKEHTEAAATVIPEKLSKMSKNIRSDSKKRFSYFISFIGIVIIGFVGRSLLKNFLHIASRMKMNKIKKAE